MSSPEHSNVEGILGKIDPQFATRIHAYEARLKYKTKNSDIRIPEESIIEYCELLVKHYYDMFMTKPKIENDLIVFRIGSVRGFKKEFIKNQVRSIKDSSPFESLDKIGIIDRIRRFLNLYGFPDGIGSIEMLADLEDVKDFDKYFSEVEDLVESALPPEDQFLQNISEYFNSNWKTGDIFRTLLKNQENIRKDVVQDQNDK